MCQRTYDSAQDLWQAQEVVDVLAADGRHIGSFPLPFIQGGGINTWAFVQDVVSRLVVEPGTLFTREGLQIELDATPVAGSVIFAPLSSFLSRSPFDHSTNQLADGARTVNFARGPEYFRKNLAPDLDAGQSSRSRSKSRSSANQTRFREAICARDSQCLITDEDYPECTACHIVPMSREDLYASILVTSRPPPLFLPSSGILLYDPLHRAFDRLEVSFYRKDDSYYVHFFNLKLNGAREYHGKVIPPARFHTKYSQNHPDPRLMQWHYDQCVMARIRGFATGLAIPQTSAAAMAAAGHAC